MTPMRTPAVRIGPAEIIALPDGQGPFFSPREEAFPGATAEQWAAADRADPGAVDAEGRWRLQFRAFAIRTEQGVTLVDTGIGPADGPAASWAPVPGLLPQSLAAAGIDPADVDTVVLTHLHTDHVGWAVVSGHTRYGEPPRPEPHPYFPNAEYVLQRKELEAIDSLNPQLRGELIAPLKEAGQLRLLDGDTALRGVRAVATPGHTPGHQSVVVASGRELAVVTGDLLVHAVQLLHPELAYAHEVDPEEAKRSREGLLAVEPWTVLRLATPHLTEPFVSVQGRSRKRPEEPGAERPGEDLGQAGRLPLNRTFGGAPGSEDARGVRHRLRHSCIQIPALVRGAPWAR